MLPALSGSSSRDSSLTHSTIAWRQRSSVSVKVRPSPAAVGNVASPSALGCSATCQPWFGPRRMGDADLAEHLRGEVQERERLVIALDARARANRSSRASLQHAFAFCAAARLEPRAHGVRQTCSTRFAAAGDLAALEPLRVAAARQVGRDHRAAEVAGRDGPGHARGRGAEDPRAARGGDRRDRRRARRRSKTPSSSAGWRPSGSTCRCRRRKRRRAPSIRSAR